LEENDYLDDGGVLTYNSMSMPFVIIYESPEFPNVHDMVVGWHDLMRTKYKNQEWKFFEFKNADNIIACTEVKK
jgi:hypothetical protein